MFFQTITALAAAEGQANKGLGIDPTQIAFYLICFVVAMLVLNKALFIPLGKILDEREARIDKALDEAEGIETQLAGINDQAKVITDQAKLEGRQVLEEARASVDPVKKQIIHDAEAIKHEIIHSANVQADKIIANANATAEKEVMTIVHKAIIKATNNISISGSAQEEILASIVNNKI